MKHCTITAEILI